AGAEFGVPADLLASIAYAETRWEMVDGHQEFEGMAAASGVMALRDARLADGARLAGVSQEAAKSDVQANVRAAAAWLSREADNLGIDRSDLGAWAPVAAAYSGIELQAAQSAYVHGAVYRALNEGVTVRDADGSVRGTIAPRTVAADFEPEESAASLQKSTDYGPAIWRPSPNNSARPSGTTPSMVIAHTCEGSYAGCWGWLANSQSGVSAHYVVNETGSEITQLVRENRKAWHIGASYNSSLNGGTQSDKNGQSSNNFTIGIEHAGYASQSSFNTGMIQASAELSCELSEDYNLPRDQYHFVGHGQLQPYNRTDPGANWPWTDYLNRINTACGSSAPSGEIIIDSNNNLNDTNKGYISVSSNWSSSSHSTDYQTGYWWAQTAAVSDGASFWFYMPTAGTKTIDAWWVAGTNRAPSAPFIMYNASGSTVGSKNVNMQANGGKWNTLGTYSFTAGWNRVMLSRWTTGGYVVIADGVRVR
ncbi:N-acetylmuramoyl-L-alanine amidase, partial [Rubricoccus marinus]